MSSRALNLATVLLLIGCAAADSAWAQAQNLEAGKSPSQLFAQTCNACHKSPRGLLKTVPSGSLAGFLRQHYTTSPEMAGVLASYLMSNGVTDTRYGGGQPKGGKEAGSSAPDRAEHVGRHQHPPQDAKPEAEPKQAAKPDGETGQPEGRGGRHAKRGARAGATSEGAKPEEGQAAPEVAGEAGLDGRGHSTKQKLSKRAKPGAEEPAKNEPAKNEPAKNEAGKGEAGKSESAKIDAGKDEAKPESLKPAEAKPAAAKPDGEKAEPAKPESAKAEPARQGGAEAPVTRPDPVPPVTPAPPAAKSAESAPASTSEPVTAKTPEPQSAAPSAETAEPRPPISR